MSLLSQTAGGYVENPDATSGCRFCAIRYTDTFLGSVGISYSDVWRNYGITWAFVVINVIGALALMWLARVPKTKADKKAKTKKE